MLLSALGIRWTERCPWYVAILVNRRGLQEMVGMDVHGTSAWPVPISRSGDPRQPSCLSRPCPAGDLDALSQASTIRHAQREKVSIEDTLGIIQYAMWHFRPLHCSAHDTLQSSFTTQEDTMQASTTPRDTTARTLQSAA